MLQAIKIKLYPNQDQKTYINKLLGTSRFIYNQCLKFKSTEYGLWNNSTKISDTYSYVMELKQEKEWIKESHSKVLQQTLINLETAFKNYFDRCKKQKKDKTVKVGYPNFKSKHDVQSCRFPVDAISGINGNRINIIKALKDVHYKCSREDEIGLNKYQKSIKSGTLSKDRSGDYYFSILLDLPLNEITPPKNDIIGIDLGIKNFIVSSEGTVYENFHFKKKKITKLKRLHRSLSMKTKGSKNRNKARIRLAKEYNKINRQKEYYLHSVVNQLLSDNQTIVMEDLNVSGMVKNHKLAESIQETSWSRFKEILLYKAFWYGREVIFIGRWFPSSKKCSCCGHVNKDLELKDRTWICSECGVTHDRDLNAAINIRNEGLRIKNLGLEFKLGMSLPEVTLQESKSKDPLRMKNQKVESYK